MKQPKMKSNRTLFAVAGFGLFTGLAQAVTITSVGTTGVFDESTNATNQLDIAVPAGTLPSFKAAVLNAYNNNLGGVIDWETGVTATASVTTTSNNTLTSITAAYGLGAANNLTISFGNTMELYTNDVVSQVSVLSQQGAFHNAILPQGTTSASRAYTMTFSGAGVTEIGAAMPSRTTYALSGVTAVNFRATANYSASSPEILNFAVGGTPGTTDTFLHFAAPSGETITSFTVAWISETGGTLTDGQRRPILDDFGFIVVPEPSTAGLVGLAVIFAALGRRRR